MDMATMKSLKINDRVQHIKTGIIRFVDVPFDGQCVTVSKAGEMPRNIWPDQRGFYVLLHTTPAKD